MRYLWTVVVIACLVALSGCGDAPVAKQPPATRAKPAVNSNRLPNAQVALIVNQAQQLNQSTPGNSFKSLCRFTRDDIIRYPHLAQWQSTCEQRDRLVQGFIAVGTCTTASSSRQPGAQSYPTCLRQAVSAQATAVDGILRSSKQFIDKQQITPTSACGQALYGTQKEIRILRNVKTSAQSLAQAIDTSSSAFRTAGKRYQRALQQFQKLDGTSEDPAKKYRVCRDSDTSVKQ